MLNVDNSSTTRRKYSIFSTVSDFHFGYFIYGAAIIARRDSSWAATYAPAINDLIRDFANPTTKDTYFGVSRMKDWYAGHSWASGLFEFGDAKNQESTSESVNGYYSVLLWGLATNDTEMASWGQVLMMTEIISAQKYWQMKESDDDPVYEQVFRQNKCVGILWGTKVDYATYV
jgi:endo-1,3(4)-beta-glucanase